MAQAALLDNFEGGEDDPPLKPAAPVIDATDIVLKEGAGGYGRGAGMPATPAPGTDVDPKGLFEGLAGIQSARGTALEKDASEAAGVAKEDSIRQHQAYNAEVATSHDIPTWDEEAMKKKFRTAPVQAFGSVGSVFAMLASAFTRRPMTNALNAGAAALDAIKAGDRQAYEDAHTAWKDNVDLAVKRFNMEHTEFQDAAALMDTDMAAAKAKMTATALKFDDQKALFLLKNGYDKELFSLMADRAKSVGEMEVAANNTTMFHQQQIALKSEFQRIDGMQKPDDMTPEVWMQQQAARKLYASVRILGDQGKMTPITRGMLLFAQEHPWAGFDEYAKAAEVLQAGGKPSAEVQQLAFALQQEAAARGETLSTSDALIQATTRLSQAKGQAALDRTKMVQEGQDRRAQLSADTRTAIAQLSASTRQEITEMQQGGQNARIEFSANARKELAALNAASRKEIEEMREKAAASKSKQGVLTPDRQIMNDANAIVQQAIAAGKLDPDDAKAVADFRAQTEAELRDRSAKSKNLTAPESNVVTMAPTALKNMQKILGLVDQSGNLIEHVPISLIGEYGGEGNGINAYNITRNQLEYDLLRMNAGGVLSAKAMHSVLDLLPPGSAALNFKRTAFQTEMANLREEVQDKVNTMEAQGKRIDPNIWESLKQFGIVPSKDRQASPLERLRHKPETLSASEVRELSQLPLREEDLELLRRLVQERRRGR